MYADGAVGIDAKNDFIARINGPGTQSMKQRKPARQEALNRLYAEIGLPELIKRQEPVAEPAPAQPESQPESPRPQPESMPQDQFESLYQTLSPEELATYRATFARLKEEPMPGAEERVSRAYKKIKDKRALEIAKTPSSLGRGRMEEMYNLIEETFSDRPGGILGPRPQTPSSLKPLAALKADIDRLFTPQVAEKLVGTNPLVRREDIPLNIETRTPAQIRRNNETALALAKRENLIRYKEAQRMERLEARLDALQARQRKSASVQRAKEIKQLLEQQDRMSQEVAALIKIEREASKARQMQGESMEAEARRRRTEARAADIARLLNDRDMAMMPRRITMPNRILPPEPPRRITLPEGMVDSSLVPPGMELFKTKSGKFRVLLSSGEAIGITEDYRDAVKLAQRYAAKKVRLRESVR
jgi:hypothetical protein